MLRDPLPPSLSSSPCCALPLTRMNCIELSKRKKDRKDPYKDVSVELSCVAQLFCLDLDCCDAATDAAHVAPGAYCFKIVFIKEALLK